MAGISRVNGSVIAPAGFYGYSPSVVKVYASNVGTADTGGSGTAIVEGNFTKAIRAIQTIASIVFIGTRGNDGFLVIVDAPTAQPTGPAYDTDATPTLAERIADVVDAATSLSTTVVVGSTSVLAVDSSGVVTLS
jgi:hypothetical protein